MSGLVSLPVIGPYAPEALGSGIAQAGGTEIINGSSMAWPTADLLLGYPFRAFRPTTITQLWWHKGSAISGNLDVGIYDPTGRRIVSSGSTAQAATVNILQLLDITDTTLGPGDYYLCGAMNNTTGTVFRASWPGSNSQGYLIGQVQMSTAFPLPATATFVNAFNSLPFIGALVWPRTVM
jgi:hypothetical protein